MKNNFKYKIIALVLTALFFTLLSFTKISYAQRRHNSITADSLLTLFSQMTPYEVFDYVPYLFIDKDDCFDNMEVRQHLVKWLDKELYFKYRLEKAKSLIFRDEERKINEVRGWLILNDKRELVDTVLNTPKLYKLYLDTVIINYCEKRRESFFHRGGSLPSDVLSFFTLFRIPEAYEIIYRYWEEDDKRRKSNYYGTLVSMLDPEAIAVANHEIDSIIATNNPQDLHYVFWRYANRHLFCEYTVDWTLKLLKSTGKWNITEFDDRPIKMVPFNVFVLNPDKYIFFPFTKHIFEYSDNEIVHDIISRLYEPFGRIYELSDKEIEVISQEIIDNYHEFELAAQPFRELIIEDCRSWKGQMPHNR